MIKSFLIKLRQKPKHVRKQVSFGVAVAFTSIVGMFWLSSVPQTIQNIGSGVSTGANTFETFRESLDKEITSTRNDPSINATASDSSTSVVATSSNNLYTPTTSASSSAVIKTSTSTPSMSAREVRIATTTSSTSQAIIQ